MTLKSDLEELLKKHGLKADDADDEKSDDQKSEKEESDKKESEVVINLADKIAEKIVKAVADKKGMGDEDKKSLLKETRSKIFTNYSGLKEISYPADLENLDKNEKILNFFKALVFAKTDMASAQVLRALVEGTDDQGGYLVPEELRAEVFRVLPDAAIMRRIARVIPMNSDTLKLNALAARPSAYWTAEYASKSTTSAEFSQVSLSPNDLVCLLPVSEQLLADANIGMVQFIIELFVEAIAAEEDKAFFTGSGTGRPKGINQETITSVEGSRITMDTIIKLIDSVPQAITKSPRAAFVAHRYVKRILRTLKNQDNDYIWRDGGAAPSSNGETVRLPDTLYGYPFYEQNDLSQEELYFGDWSYYIIGDRQAVSVRTTTEGGDAWRRNAMEIKAVERVDGKVVLTTPFAKATNIIP